jgi:hypothetical protein
VPPIPPGPASGVDSKRPRLGSVSYARWLLYVQASIWGLLCAGAVVNSISSYPWLDPALTIGAASGCGVLAAAKAGLGLWIPRGSDRTRHVVIAVESVMAGFGVLLALPLAVPQGGAALALACLVGGVLSLVAVIALTQPPAKQYFAPRSGNVAQADPTSRSGDEGSTSFWRRALVQSQYCPRSHTSPGAPA